MLDNSFSLLSESAAPVAAGTLLLNRGDAVDRIVHVMQGRVGLGVMADGQMAHQLGVLLAALTTAHAPLLAGAIAGHLVGPIGTNVHATFQQQQAAAQAAADQAALAQAGAQQAQAQAAALVAQAQTIVQAADARANAQAVGPPGPLFGDGFAPGVRGLDDSPFGPGAPLRGGNVFGMGYGNYR